MSTKRYDITPRQQLIDINSTVINFEAKISAVSIEELPFDAIVVTQKELQASPKLDFKRVEHGIFGVEISQNKNMYENFFLVLRADTPTKVDVTIELNPLPMLEGGLVNPSQGNTISEVPPGRASVEQLYASTPKPPEVYPSVQQPLQEVSAKKKSFFQKWKFILIVLIIAVGGYFIWKFYISKNKEKSSSDGNGFGGFGSGSGLPLQASIERQQPLQVLPIATEEVADSGGDDGVDPELLGKLNKMFV